MEDRELLARLIQCEAGGEGNDGMAAVGTVLLNRMRAQEGEFARVNRGGDLRAVLFQEGQFTCAAETLRDGAYNPQNIYNMTPEPIHYAIADSILAGMILPAAAESYFFFNPFSETCPEFFPSEVGRFDVRIGAHCFYAPTEKYRET